MSNSEYDSEPKYWAVVPAAGVGKRMNVDIPKQYLEIRGKTLIEHTLERLIAFTMLEKIVVVLSPDDEYAPNIAALKHDKVILADGGTERYHSVVNGLKTLAPLAAAADWIMVHDAARPCVRQSDLEWLVKCLAGHPVGGLLGLPVRDTMKRVQTDDLIVETVERSALWHAYTPQMFRFELLVSALNKAIQDKVPVTDEASAMEYSGHKPMMVEGHPDNIKVTCGPDLALASLYIEQQSKLIESM